MADKLIISGLVVVVLAGVVVARIWTARNRRGFSTVFVKLYGLLSISGFALLLAITTSAEPNVKTAGFTVLGTIAGFLAGKDFPEEPAGNDDARHHTPTTSTPTSSDS